MFITETTEKKEYKNIKETNEAGWIKNYWYKRIN